VRALTTAVPKVLGRLLDNRELRPAMLTLTCKDRADLPSMIDELLGAFGTWIRRRRNQQAGRRGFTSLSLVDGGILSCETKRGSGSGLWHFHAHAVVLVPAGLADGKHYPEFSHRFYQEWSELLGYSATLDARYLKSAALIDRHRSVEEVRTQLSEELLEVFKYSLKTTELDFEDRYAAATVLHRRRLVRAFGSMHGYEPPEDVTDDLDAFEGLPYLELVYRYLQGRYVEGNLHEYPKQNPRLATVS
jgi:hypothetical protein